jgi:hypothetical protein
MTIGLTHTPLPGPRPAKPTTPSPEALREAVYREFVYGIGEAPGIDLGRPVAYTRAGGVYRQRFERGLTLANIGSCPVEVDLDGGYRDLDGEPCARVTLAPRSATVLLADPS